MLNILPVVTIAIIFFDLLGLQGDDPARLKDWRFALLQTALVGGVFVALQSELLGLVHALATGYTAVFWAAGLLLSAWLGWRTGLLRRGWGNLLSGLRSVDRSTGMILAVFGLIALLLLVIVVIAPASTMDSLHYHMSRVMHWVQDRSLAHYPTGYEPQLVNPIEAELFILQLRLLLGSDQLANLPQWLSLIGCAVAVSLGAKILGAGRKSQLAAAAFAISIPIGLLEATNTKNDYVTALWLTILSVLVLYATQVEASWVEVLCIASALGLGMLTKGTFYPFAIPFGLWLLIHWFKQKNIRQFLKYSLVIILIVLVLNAGYWTRNMITYGGPLGPSEWVLALTSSKTGLVATGSNLVKNVLLNFATPSPKVNQGLVKAVQTSFQSTDQDVSNFQLDWRWNTEDSAGSPLHILIIILAMISVSVLYLAGKIKRRHIVWYSLACILAAVAFGVVVHYDQYGVRYQLPLFIIWAPIVGAVIFHINEKWLAPLATAFFIVISIPYVLFNTTRPIIALKNEPEPFAMHPLPAMGTTKSSSIFYSSQRDLLFINAPEWETPLIEATHDIRDSRCLAVGMRIDSHDVEYPIWWLLKAPQSGIRIESLYYSDALSRYADTSFKPCAIVCTICGARKQLDGLPLFGSYDGWINLYMGESYNPETGQ